MNEQLQSPREQSSGPSGWDSIFDEPADAPGRVLISSGPHQELLSLANMTVGEIRARFRDRFDIDDTARAVLDGADVNNDTIVRQGQVLMFTHRAGEKGIAERQALALQPLLNPEIRVHETERNSETRSFVDSRVDPSHTPRWRPGVRLNSGIEIDSRLAIAKSRGVHEL